MADTTTADLLKRLKGGDPSVNLELYKCVEGRLKARAAQLIRRTPLLAGNISPSDVLQSVFVQLLAAGVPSDLECGTGFLVKTMRLRAAHHARAYGQLKRNRKQEDRSEEARAGLKANVQSASQIASNAEEAEIAARVIREMSEADRTVITLRLDGMSWQAIGMALGTTREAARKRHHHAMGRLRAQLGVDLTE